MFFRYEVPKLNQGIFGAIEDILDLNNEEELDLLFELVAYFEDNLKAPDINMEDTESWFTQKGNRKFKKSIKKIINALKERNYSVSCIQKELNENEILYKDEYQIIISRKSSTTIP